MMRSFSVERHLGVVWERSDQQERQLVQIWKVHGHQLRLQGRPHWWPHQQLSPREVPGGPTARGREKLSFFLPGRLFHL